MAAGVLLSLLNPYWSIWWATVGLLYITQALQGGTGVVAAFYSGHILADLAWYSLVAALLAGGRRFVSRKVYAGVLLVCSLFLVGLGVYFILMLILNMK